MHSYILTKSIDLNRSFFLQLFHFNNYYFIFLIIFINFKLSINRFIFLLLISVIIFIILFLFLIFTLIFLFIQFFFFFLTKNPDNFHKFYYLFCFSKDFIQITILFFLIHLFFLQFLF